MLSPSPSLAMLIEYLQSSHVSHAFDPLGNRQRPLRQIVETDGGSLFNTNTYALCLLHSNKTHHMYTELVAATDNRSWSSAYLTGVILSLAEE